MKTRKVAILSALILTTPIVYADGAWLSTGGVSWHSKPGYNGSNGGVGAEYHVSPRYDLAVGTYRNSYEKRSHYAFIVRRYGLTHSVAFGLAVGMVDGYPGINDGRLAPATLPLLMFEGRRVGINALYIPPFGTDRVNVVGVQFKFRLD